MTEQIMDQQIGECESNEGTDGMAELSGWYESFQRITDQTDQQQYNFHCWQLQEDMLELRFYAELVYLQIVFEPGQKRRVKLLEDLNNKE